jgi:hypothetical protein
MPEKNWLRILALQLLQPLGIGQVHPAILGLQLAERRWDQPMLAAQFGSPAECFLIILMNCASVKRLFLMLFALSKIRQTLHHSEGTFGGQVTQPPPQ